MSRQDDHLEIQPSSSRSEQIVSILALPNHETVGGDGDQFCDPAPSQSDLSEVIGSFQAEVGRLRCLVVELLIKNEEFRRKYAQQQIVLDLRNSGDR
jgi:hypothetical protein